MKMASSEARSAAPEGTESDSGDRTTSGRRADRSRPPGHVLLVLPRHVILSVEWRQNLPRVLAPEIRDIGGGNIDADGGAHPRSRAHAGMYINDPPISPPVAHGLEIEGTKKRHLTRQAFRES